MRPGYFIPCRSDSQRLQARDCDLPRSPLRFQNTMSATVLTAKFSGEARDYLRGA